MLSIIDYATAYVQFLPVRSKSTAELKQRLFEYFGIFGTPKTLHGDQERALVSKEVESLLMQRGIEVTTRGVDDSRQNGQVERCQAWMLEQRDLDSSLQPDYIQWTAVLSLFQSCLEQSFLNIFTFCKR